MVNQNEQYQEVMKNGESKYILTYIDLDKPILLNFFFFYRLDQKLSRELNSDTDGDDEDDEDDNNTNHKDTTTC